MGASRELSPQPSQLAQELRLLDFLLKHQEVTRGHAGATRVFFGLDNILFCRSHETTKGVRGSWRPDMPQLVEGLLEEGFALSVLAHASRGYVNAALGIYEKQFNHCSSQVFDGAFILGDYSYSCNRDEVFPALSKETFQNEGKRSLFIDTFLSPLIISAETQYVCVPEPLQYGSHQGQTFYNPIEQ